MNDTQQIFTTFFAIFWSVMANAQPKWKAFHYTFFLRILQVTNRTVVSFLILNVLPIFYFSWSFNRLGVASKDNAINQSVLHGVIPAFAIFGFYRIWVCIIEFLPRFFYREKDNNQYPNSYIEPTLESLHILTDRTRFKNALMNLFFGIIYIGIGLFFDLVI